MRRDARLEEVLSQSRRELDFFVNVVIVDPMNLNTLKQS